MNRHKLLNLINRIISNGGPERCRYAGICCSIEIQFLEVTGVHLVDWFEDELSTWEHYSGSCKYPIEYDQGISSERAYILVSDLWVGEYGRRRIEVLKMIRVWLIEWIEYNRDDYGKKQ